MKPTPITVTRVNPATGELQGKPQKVAAALFKPDAGAPTLPEHCPPPPIEPVGTVGWICVKWFEYREARADKERFDAEVEAYWSHYAMKLTRQERRDLARGRIVGIVRPVEPVWKKGDRLEITDKITARVEGIQRILNGWRTEVIIEDFRSFFMKRIVGGSSRPKTDRYGYAIPVDAAVEETARLDGAYTQAEEQAVTDGGEVLDDKLYQRIHAEQSMGNAMKQSKGRVRQSRMQLEMRLAEARSKHRRSTVRYLKRQLESLERKAGKAA